MCEDCEKFFCVFWVCVNSSGICYGDGVYFDCKLICWK